jgi:peroxiredoxin
MKKLILLSGILFSVIASAQTLQFKIGDKAPVFSGKAHDGNDFSLQTSGTTVLLFYRGYWCPFCNKELSALNDSLSFLQQKNASVVAVTPEKYESVDKTIAKTKAAFTIISDTANAILKLYGVNFKVDDNTVERYKKFGVDFSTVNANKENTLPVPAVFIIKDGIIKYIWFDKDYRKRPTIKELLDNL